MIVGVSGCLAGSGNRFSRCGGVGAFVGEIPQFVGVEALLDIAGLLLVLVHMASQIGQFFGVT